MAALLARATFPVSEKVKTPRASAKINLRVSDEQRTLIDRAAAVRGQSRTEFMLESASREAENALLDRQLFLLDEAQYKQFMQCLDAPAKPSDALKDLMRTPAPWEK